MSRLMTHTRTTECEDRARILETEFAIRIRIRKEKCSETDVRGNPRKSLSREITVRPLAIGGSR